MKVHIYAVANTYSDRGWELSLVEETNKWKLTSYVERKDVVYLESVDIETPSDAAVLMIAEKRIEEMEEELLDQTTRAREKIRDYEAKFLLIKAEELS